MLWRLRATPAYQALAATLRCAAVLAVFFGLVCWLNGLSLLAPLRWPGVLLPAGILLLWFFFQLGHAHAEAARRERRVRDRRYIRSVQQGWSNLHPVDRTIARGRLEAIGREGGERPPPPPHTSSPPASGYPGYAWLEGKTPFEGRDPGEGAGTG